MSVINRDLSIDELYANLLIQQRQHERNLESGHASCSWCNLNKRSHLHDGRCSSSALSQTFRYVDQSKMDQIAKSIRLVEELIGL